MDLNNILESLVEAIVAEEIGKYRATLSGTKPFRKPVHGIDSTQLVNVIPMSKPSGSYGKADYMSGKNKGRFDVSNPRMDQDTRDATEKVRK